MSIWAVTAFFNPRRYAARLSNYLLFRQQLGVPLLTVEWSKVGLFELNDHDAEILVRVAGGDLMWQKERLLRIAISHLPDDCDKILMTDADLLLLENDWPQRIAEQLEHHPVVQPFREVHHLAPLPQDVLESVPWKTSQPYQRPVYLARQSFADFCLHGARPAQTPNVRLQNAQGYLDEVNRLAERSSFGHAWAVRRDWIESIGLYEHCVAGSGDLAFAMAIAGRSEELCHSYPLNAAQQAHYLRWAANAQKAVAPERLSSLDGVALHLFHGHLYRRNYRSRLEVLAASGFDPGLDLCADPDGPFRWADTNKRSEALRSFFAAYFRDRAEDEDRAPCGEAATARPA